MTEEKNTVKNGEATTEMAPQEDGTKVPLTNDAGPEVGTVFSINDCHGFFFLLLVYSHVIFLNT